MGCDVHKRATTKEVLVWYLNTRMIFATKRFMKVSTAAKKRKRKAKSLMKTIKLNAVHIEEEGDNNKSGQKRKSTDLVAPTQRPPPLQPSPGLQKNVPQLLLPHLQPDLQLLISLIILLQALLLLPKGLLPLQPNPKLKARLLQNLLPLLQPEMQLLKNLILLLQAPLPSHKRLQPLQHLQPNPRLKPKLKARLLQKLLPPLQPNQGLLKKGSWRVMTPLLLLLKSRKWTPAPAPLGQGGPGKSTLNTLTTSTFDCLYLIVLNIQWETY